MYHLSDDSNQLTFHRFHSLDIYYESKEEKQTVNLGNVEDIMGDFEIKSNLFLIGNQVFHYLVDCLIGICEANNIPKQLIETDLIIICTSGCFRSCGAGVCSICIERNLQNAESIFLVILTE